MNRKTILADVKKELEKILSHFNQKILKDTLFPYTVKMDDQEFSIYKYSSNRYDPDDWFFPGFNYVDGTVEGALKAGEEVYS